MTETQADGWLADLESAYTTFATHHAARLTSRVLLETALNSMSVRAGRAVEAPLFSERAGVVPEDLAQFLAAAATLQQATPGLTGEELRDAAIEELVRLKPDGHTEYWAQFEDVPFRNWLEDEAGLTSRLLPGGVGYLRWTGWVRADTYSIADEVRKCLDRLLSDGARAWLVDLRGNRGGNVGESRRLAGMFLDGEVLWIRRSPDGTESRAADQSDRLAESYQLPIAIAIDHETWSASELFTLALRQHGRALVIGEQSAGRVGSCTGVRLPGGGFLIVATAEFTGPHGEVYNGTGITPDIPASSETAVEVAADQLRRHIGRAPGAR